MLPIVPIGKEPNLPVPEQNMLQSGELARGRACAHDTHTHESPCMPRMCTHTFENVQLHTRLTTAAASVAIAAPGYSILG